MLCDQVLWAPFFSCVFFAVIKTLEVCKQCCWPMYTPALLTCMSRQCKLACAWAWLTVAQGICIFSRVHVWVHSQMLCRQVANVMQQLRWLAPVTFGIWLEIEWTTAGHPSTDHSHHKGKACQDPSCQLRHVAFGTHHQFQVHSVISENLVHQLCSGKDCCRATEAVCMSLFRSPIYTKFGSSETCSVPVCRSSGVLICPTCRAKPEQLLLELSPDS